MANNDCIINMKNCTKKNESDNERSRSETWSDKCRGNIIYLSRNIQFFLNKNIELENQTSHLSFT